MKNIPATLLYVSPSTAAWMKAETKKMNDKHGGNVGLATLARAVLTGICEAQVDLSSARGEHDITDIVRTLVTETATTKEGKQ
ncbi:MAG: hypothetical protein WDO73_09845 [Ignavibacteriota bacterium]